MVQLNKIKTKKTRGLSMTPKSYKNLYQSLRLGQIKPNITAKEAQKQANQTSKHVKINQDIPIYELSLYNITIDISNSFKYIRECFDKLNNKQKEAIIYKAEHGSKSVFFSCANLT